MMSRPFFAIPAMALVIMGLCACASSTPAVATAEVNEAGEYVFEDGDRQNEVVCKRERVTGSNRPRRVCKTRALLEQERQEAQDALARMSPSVGNKLPRSKN